MKILMFGRGGIALAYGWALEGAGHSVDFYVRPGRKETLASDLKIDIYDMRSNESDQRRQESWSIRMIEQLPADHDYDLIVLSVQHYQFADAAQFLATRMSAATLLIFNNFWTDPLESSALLPQDQLAWGFPVASVRVEGEDVLRGALMPRVEFGTFGTDPTEREEAVRQLFRDAGFFVNEHRDFRDWLWIHFARNAGLLAQAARAGSVLKVMMSFRHSQQMILNVREALKVVAARGVSLEGRGELAAYNGSTSAGARKLNAMFGSSPAMQASISGDATVDSYRPFYNSLMDEAKKLGVAVPRLEAISPFFD